MKKNYIFLAALAMQMLPASAQDTYQSAKLIENDLNGTARYVGMGGAMEALGADISTMSTNPAGIGLFRNSQVSLSGGLLFQTGADNKMRYNHSEINFGGKKTNLSFDQIGIVWTMPAANRRSFLNIGFNYRKSRNFDQILTAANDLGGASQNRLTAIKYNYNVTKKKNEYQLPWNGVDVNYEGCMAKNDQGFMDYLGGDYFLTGQYAKGYIGEYSLNFSGNLNDRIYLGATVGIHDVNYRNNSIYAEALEQNNSATTWESLSIDGQGYDVKVGAIFRPIEYSPFRIGVYFNSPVFYDLTMSSATDLTMVGGDKRAEHGQKADYDFCLNTPAKFGISLGHTIGQSLALGATYEYSDYSWLDNRIKGDGYINYYGDYVENSYSDRAMKENTKQVLRGVHTLKLGVEYKPFSSLALRAGYNLMTGAYKMDGFRDGSIDSPGTLYATSTDYTNWKSTNRVTLGVGYSAKKFFIDLAYQLSSTSGEYYPFMAYYSDKENESNVSHATKVDVDRNQLLLTLGFKL